MTHEERMNYKKNFNYETTVLAKELKKREKLKELSSDYDLLTKSINIAALRTNYWYVLSDERNENDSLQETINKMAADSFSKKLMNNYGETMINRSWDEVEKLSRGIY